jgi:glycosyltransferase involved in cell wall biosynthesis
MKVLLVQSNVLGNRVLGDYLADALESHAGLDTTKIEVSSEDVHQQAMPPFLARSILARRHWAISRALRQHDIHPARFEAVVCNSFTILLALGPAFRSLRRVCLFDGSSFAHREVIPGLRKPPCLRDRAKALTYSRILGGNLSLLPLSQWARNAHEKYFRHEQPINTMVCSPYSRLDVISRSDMDTARPTGSSADQDLKLLFVGNYLSKKGGYDLIRLHRERLYKFCSLTVVTRQVVTETHPKLLVINDVGVEHRERIEHIYRTHDLFVFPSTFDFFGLVVLEAMSQGLPVVAYDVAAMPEMVRDGINGHLIPYDEDRFATLVDTIERLALNRHDLNRMGANSVSLIRERFPRARFDSTVQQTLVTDYHSV